MAKSIKRIAVTGEVGSNYWHVDDVPWEDIEGRTGHQFSESDREEIRAIAGQALAQYDVAFGAPSASEVEALRNEIIQHVQRHCRDYEEISDTGRPACNEERWA